MQFHRLVIRLVTAVAISSLLSLPARANPIEALAIQLGLGDEGLKEIDRNESKELSRCLDKKADSNIGLRECFSKENHQWEIRIERLLLYKRESLSSRKYRKLMASHVMWKKRQNKYCDIATKSYGIGSDRAVLLDVCYLQTNLLRAKRIEEFK